MNKWIKRCGVYIYTMEYNSALKKKKILTYAIPWRSLGDIILSKVNQLCTTCLIPIIWSPLVVKLIEMQSSMVVGAGGRGNGEIFND